MEDFLMNDTRNIHPVYIFLQTNYSKTYYLKKKKKIATINQRFPIFPLLKLCIIFTISVFAQFARFSTNISFPA